MSRKDTVIKHLKMMGYDVTNDGENIRVILRTSSGYAFSQLITIEHAYDDFVIEEIVASINNRIIREL